jgi:hypothetical protein
VAPYTKYLVNFLKNSRCKKYVTKVISDKNNAILYHHQTGAEGCIGWGISVD